MQAFYCSLSEKNKRHYAAIEADKLKYGGVQYIADLFNCSRQTVHTGLEELKKRFFTGKSDSSQRRRKKIS